MAVGIGYSILPIFMLFSNPMIGFLMDYFQNLKIFLITILLTCSFSYSSVLSLPPIPYEVDNLAYLQISDINTLQPLINVSEPFKKHCLVEILDRNIRCKLELEVESATTNLTYLPITIDITYEVNKSNRSRREQWMESWIVFYSNDISRTQIKDRMKAGRILQCSTNFQHCSLSTDSKSVFYTYQFWVFFTLIVIGGITWNSAMNLSSVACYVALGTQIEAYGNQRLFGTISTGIISSLAGLFNDVFISDKKSFLTGFYLMAVLMVISIINLFFIDIPKSHITKSNMLKNIGKILNSKEIVVFGLGTVFVGIFASTISLYEFWFLEDMGANRTVFGLAKAMQCLLGEAPFLFFTGWLVNHLGYSLCFASVFAGFAVRFLLYSILRDPWLVLPIDMLHGITFGLFHGASTSFAKVTAPKGLEATIMGFFSGMYDGLGIKWIIVYFLLNFNLTSFKLSKLSV